MAMGLNLSRRLSTKHISSAVLWLAVLSFNNWLLAIVFNRQLLLRDGSVSEFSVASQPHSWLFRSLDIISGLLFLAVAVLIYKKTRPGGIGARIIILATTLLAIGNFFDALIPLNCSEALSANCQLPVNISLTHLVLPDHAYSSIAIGLSYFLLPLGGFIYGKARGWRTFMYISAAVLAVALISFISVLGNYATKNSFSIRTFGLSQEIQMMVIGFWFVSWYHWPPGKVDKEITTKSRAGALNGR